jgi:hypothetical protein
MNKSGTIRILALAVVLALSWVRATAQEKKSEQPAPQATTSNVSETNKKSGHEGIQVHGHWTIEVRNKDGALVSHTEFENSLATGASAWFAKVLARQASWGPWGMIVTSGGAGTFNLFTGGGLPAGPCDSGMACILAESGIGLPSGAVSGTLTITAGQTFLLSGIVTAKTTAKIGGVGTFVIGCPATTAPASSCGLPTGGFGQGTTATGVAPLTEATLPAPVNVQPGQLIAINVEISFS